MRSAELITLGVDGPLESKLASWCLDHGMHHRAVSKPAVARQLLDKGSRGVLLLRVGRDLADEFDLIRAAADRDVTTIVMGDLEHPHLEGLAYDLGADVVLFAPRPVDDLFEVLELCRSAAP